MKVSRRDMLKRATAAASGAIAAPSVVPATVFGARAPSERIGVGCIGVGNHGIRLVQGFLHAPDARVVAVCDVNTASRGYKTPSQYLGREPARQIVDEHYGRQARSGRVRGCQAARDFREVLARDDVDAVALAVPDHWHAVMTVLAAEAGKDIYCEKPLSLTVADGRAMVRAVRRCGAVLQTGSQERSNPTSRFACELVRNGRIGRLVRIRAYVGPNNRQCPPGAWLPMRVPKGFDYDLWLGPAPWQPYHRDRCLYSYRFILDYSGGQVTNYGAHCIDLAQWGAGTDRSAPIEIEDLGSEFPRDGLFDTATKVHFRARYATAWSWSAARARTTWPSASRAPTAGSRRATRASSPSRPR